MTSILKADTIQDTDGNNIINENSNTITIGASGDTTNIVGTLQNNGAAVGGTNTPNFKVYRNTTQSISSASWTKMQFNTESFDTASAFDNSTNYRFTVPSGQAGKYFFTCHGQIAQSTQDLNRLIIAIRKNGTAVVELEEDGAYDEYTMSFQATLIDDASVGDYYEGWIYQINSGSDALNMQADRKNGFSGFKLIE